MDENSLDENAMDENSTLSGILLLLHLKTGPHLQLFCFLTAEDEDLSLYVAKAVSFLLLCNKRPQRVALKKHPLSIRQLCGLGVWADWTRFCSGCHVSCAIVHNINTGVESHHINRFQGLGHRILRGHF